MDPITNTTHNAQYVSLAFYLSAPTSGVADCIGAVRTHLEPITKATHRVSLRLPKDQKRKRCTLDEAFEIARDAAAHGKATYVFARNRRASLCSLNELLWHVDWDIDPIANGIQCEPCLLVSVGLSFIDPHTEFNCVGILRDVGACMSQLPEFCHGLADVCTAEECGRGFLYGSPGIINLPFDRQLRRLVWLRSGQKRRHRLRGVFWGQVLSADVARRLGDPEEFARQYREYRKFTDGSERDLVEVLPGGAILVLVTRSMQDMLRPLIGLTPFDVERAAWLHERFEQAGIL